MVGGKDGIDLRLELAQRLLELVLPVRLALADAVLERLALLGLKLPARLPSPPLLLHVRDVLLLRPDAQVHDVRFLATHDSQERILAKYRDKLEHKARQQGLKDLDELKEQYKDKIEELRKQAIVPGATAPLTPPPETPWPSPPPPPPDLAENPIDTVDSTPPDPIIFDDQYLTSLVGHGVIGLGAVLWLVGALVFRLMRASRRARGSLPLLSACTAAVAGFAAAMLTFDAFAFVQCTIFFFAIAALGLRLAHFHGLDRKAGEPAVAPTQA